MKNKKLSLIFAGSLVIIGITLTFSSPKRWLTKDDKGSMTLEFSSQTQRPDTDDEVKRLENLAQNIVRMNLGKVTERGGSHNMIGLRSDQMTISRRVDSRTYFVQDLRYGLHKEAGVFQYPDSAFLNRSRQIVRQFGIPVVEIARAKVLKEKYQTGRVNPRTGKVTPGKIQDGRRMANLSRQIEGVPVFSSRARIGLTRGGGIGLMELHWPEIPKETVREARRLQAIVRRGWRPPILKGARVESVQAGIIHSPAVGFVLDVYPAIRVIYASQVRGLGKKAVQYVDASGQSVPVPRQFERIDLPVYKDRKGK